MKKIIIIVFAILFLFVGNVAYGQCMDIARNLSVGSRGSDVNMLQRFLVDQGYPGAGSWMITGYFGRATKTAVQNFQSTYNLTRSGVLDYPTRMAINNASCNAKTLSGYTQYNDPAVAYYNPLASYTYNYSPYYNSQWCAFGSYNCQSSVQIKQISPVSGIVGSTVSLYGDNLASLGNNVNIGGTIVAGIPSLDGKSINFVVPNLAIGTYKVSMLTANGGVTNTLDFSVTNTSNTGVIIGPNTLQTQVAGTWSISVNNTSQYFGTLVVSWGDNTVSSQQTVYNTGSQTLSFTHSYAQSGVYNIYATYVLPAGNAGTWSHSVTVGGGFGSGVPAVASVSPMTGRVGTQIIITGTGFLTTENTIHFGSGGMQHVPSVDGTTIYYTVPSYLSPCDVAPHGTVCAMYAQMVTAGQYPLYISNANGTTQTITYTVQ